MKMKSMMASALAALVLTACSDNDSGPLGPVDTDIDVAYVSINVATESLTKASGEDPGTNESDLNSIYILTFDGAADQKILKIPETNSFYIAITGASATTTPDAFKISAAAKNLLVIANPGTALLNVLNSINEYSTFSSINAAITSTSVNEITGTNGFTMINSGDETGVAVNSKITRKLIDIDGKMVTVDESNPALDTEAKAKAEAENNQRVDVTIERLATKVGFKTDATITTVPAAGDFNFLNWTLDAINTSFYPYAEKTILSVAHTAGFYANNFYTQDPNFTTAETGDANIGAGLEFTTVKNDYTLDMVNPWKNNTEFLYSIENTMEASEQKYGNATRVVIKGEFYPDATWKTGNDDWFSYAGENYKDLATLQAAYTAAIPGSNLIAACDEMFDAIEKYFISISNPLPATITGFEDLTQTELDLIVNSANEPVGGEILKKEAIANGSDSVIRWYQRGLCYYYYEIRHDDVTTVSMAFGKYGVVRNNWYSLTLNKVNGPGTPWYPDINEPGPGDPDPKDPIDEEAGFLGIEIERAPWIVWERPIEI